MCYFFKTQLPFQLYILNNILYNLKCLYVLILGYLNIKRFHSNQMYVLALVSNIPKILTMRENYSEKRSVSRPNQNPGSWNNSTVRSKRFPTIEGDTMSLKLFLGHSKLLFF